MANSGALRQLLRSLCHNTCWKYAAFWKLEHRNHTILTLEDAYINKSKPSVVEENTLQDGFFCGKNQPGIISFGGELDGSIGNYSGDLVEVAVANMSGHTFLLGEGIVGKVAVRKKHYWVFTDKYNSKLLPECPEECQLQFAAGIKTILFVPIIPLGVVQLGSLLTIMEDSALVIRIKDLFSTFRHNASSCISVNPRMDHSDHYTPISTPLKANHSASTSICGMLDPISLLPAEKDSILNWYRPYEGYMPCISTQFQADIPMSYYVLDEVLGMDTYPNIDRSKQKVTHSKLVIDSTENLCLLDQSVYTDCVIEGVEDEPALISDINQTFYPEQPTENLCLLDQSVYTDCVIEGVEDEPDLISDINQTFYPEQPTFLASFMKYENNSDLCFVENMKSTENQDFGREVVQGTKNIVNGNSLSFPFHSELHKALGLDSLEEHDANVYNDTASEIDELRYATSIYSIEMPETCKSSIEKTSQLEDSIAHIVVTENLLCATDDIMPEFSTYPGSCLTQSRNNYNDFDSEEAVPVNPLSLPMDEDFISSTNDDSSKSTFSSLINDEESIHNMTDKLGKQGIKSSQSNKRRGRSCDSHKPRPRDRQLIQERLKELRDLIPNGAKCSIDVLLDRTVNHMLFLQSIPERAQKLRHSTYSKNKLEDRVLPIAQASQNGASWAYELGSQPQVCPLVVENLDQPGQMLVEMLCKEYGLFLEIAQIIKCLKLTILKGVLESRSDNLWAHFIIEASRGFHRMDILLPLMQLLQRN